MKKGVESSLPCEDKSAAIGALRFSKSAGDGSWPSGISRIKKQHSGLLHGAEVLEDSSSSGQHGLSLQQRSLIVVPRQTDIGTDAAGK